MDAVSIAARMGVWEIRFQSICVRLSEVTDYAGLSVLRVEDWKQAVRVEMLARLQRFVIIASVF